MEGLITIQPWDWNTRKLSGGRQRVTKRKTGSLTLSEDLVHINFYRPGDFGNSVDFICMGYISIHTRLITLTARRGLKMYNISLIIPG